MKIERFTENDILEAARLAYPVWGVGHADDGQGEEFGLLMCEYIVRYGWYGAPYALLPALNENQKIEALALKDYFVNTGSKVYEHMTADKDLYLSFFLSSVLGCGKQLLAELIALAKSEGYESMYLWTDSSCRHSYYAHHGFELVSSFKSGEWATDSDEYLTFIYRKSF